MKNITQKTIILGIIPLLLTLSLTPTQAKNTDNIVADIAVTWDSLLHNLAAKKFGPNVTITQSTTTDFYFPEINGTIPHINFTVVCKHKLLTKVILPRFTQVYLAVSYNGTYILLNQTKNIRCQSLDWEYINLSVSSNSGFIPLQTQGQNITLNIEVGAYFFVFGAIQQLAPIKIHPVPQ